MKQVDVEMPLDAAEALLAFVTEHLSDDDFADVGDDEGSPLGRAVVAVEMAVKAAHSRGTA